MLQFPANPSIDWFSYAPAPFSRSDGQLAPSWIRSEQLAVTRVHFPVKLRSGERWRSGTSVRVGLVWNSRAFGAPSVNAVTEFVAGGRAQAP